MINAKDILQTESQFVEIGRHAIGIDIGTSTICFTIFDIDTLSVISMRNTDNTSSSTIGNHRESISTIQRRAFTCKDYCNYRANAWCYSA